MMTLTQAVHENIDQYNRNREHSEQAGCPVFNIFYPEDGQTKILFFTTRDELHISEDEARPIIEKFHQDQLSQ